MPARRAALRWRTGVPDVAFGAFLAAGVAAAAAPYPTTFTVSQALNALATARSRTQAR